MKVTLSSANCLKGRSNYMLTGTKYLVVKLSDSLSNYQLKGCYDM